jgi:hypothetical protein
MIDVTGVEISAKGTILVCLRTMANIASVSNGEQLGDLWSLVLETDGSFIRLSFMNLL